VLLEGKGWAEGNAWSDRKRDCIVIRHDRKRIEGPFALADLDEDGVMVFDGNKRNSMVRPHRGGQNHPNAHRAGHSG